MSSKVFLTVALLAAVILTSSSAEPLRRYRQTQNADGGTGSVREPFSMERINRALRTLLNGVRAGSLEEILRGSFMFTRNGNVRSTANNVLSSVFGTPVRQEDALPPGSSRTPTRVNDKKTGDNNALNTAVGSASRSS